MAKKGKRKHKGGKRKHKGGKKKRRVTSFRGEIKYTPCRKPNGRFTRKPVCKR